MARFEEGRSISCPPLFEGEAYVQWSNFMKYFIQAQEFEVWEIIEYGYLEAPKKMKKLRSENDTKIEVGWQLGRRQATTATDGDSVFDGGDSRSVAAAPGSNSKGQTRNGGRGFGPTFYQIYKRKAVEEFQPYPYLCTVMNCIIWMFYGLPVVKKDNILVLTINSVGLVIELLYLTVYVVYANDRKKRLLVGSILLCEAASTVVIVLVALFPLYTHRTVFVGIIADVFNIIMYAAPLAIWRKVIQTRSVEYMPFWLSLAGFCNGVCWTVYGLLQFDIFILVSNGLGALFGFVQLALYAFYFFNGNPKSKDQVKKPAQLQLSHLPSPA
ncbi:hypothetical protein GQ457_14G019360 [Hibiscus cannabinus]